MSYLQTLLLRLDSLQRSRRLSAFLYAVIKKYGEDQAGYQAALLTYYAFLSLFPLLLVLTTVTGLIGGSHGELQQKIIKAITDYFPGFGNQLSNVDSLHGSGLGLIVGLLFSFYGARGVADAFRNGVNNLWQVPFTRRDGFPRSLLKSLSMIAVGGLGLIAASVSSGIAASAGRGITFTALAILINITILFFLFNWLINASLPQHVSLRNTRGGALTVALGLVLLQTFGAVILRRELQHLDAVYSYFALSLGLLFWLYLQAQVLYVAVEVSSVRTKRLWPRSISGDITAADKKQLQRLSGK